MRPSSQQLVTHADLLRIIVFSTREKNMGMTLRERVSVSLYIFFSQ